MGRHSRKGRAPKGETDEMSTARTATSAGTGDREPAPRAPEAQGAPRAGGPGSRGAGSTSAPAAQAGAQSPGGTPLPRRYDGTPGQGIPRFTGGAPGIQGPRSPDGTPAHGFPRLPGGTPAHGAPRYADGTPAHGFPRLPDGTLAHGMPRLPDGTPAHGFPRLPDGTPDRGYPVSRGGHPEQREAGGGWGHSGGGGRRTGAEHGVAHGAPAGAPYGVPGEAAPPGAPYGVPPERSGRRLPIPRQRQETMPPGGPRQTYLDAFDEVDDVFAPGRTHRAAPGADADGRVEAAFAEKPLQEKPSREEPLRQKPSRASGEQPPGDDSEDVETAKGGKGRAFAGIAAAAVTTVLAVVVGGQMAGGQDDGTATQSQAADAGERAVRDASRSDNRPTPSSSPSPSATPLSYDQKMGKKYELAADLEGGGKFEAVKGFDKAPGVGRKYRYRVDVEKGLGLDAGLFADAVQKTLNDERSWAHGGGRTFERISSGTPDFVITLASPGTTATWCAKSGLDTTVDNVSCDSAATERVMINAYRWAQGSETYGDQIHAYRQMLINHEIGHRLDYPHVTCDKDGELAPVMQQQSKFLTYDGITCKANPWPYPGS
ncbi:DUF3152 domain-containing protein [Streptomyces sp. NBC_00481]|uniref:DUF3152 domain-containing protein n=1 Tax=unclassified Streptomyces TaxID=2593676 RepID=UPI002DD94D13|nr:MULTISPECIES: DUF3152 domain-containing protein [unclassified Streptomyces]WRY95886.1 DUF3152 domain-containing protein [Streptomyces sp. NBC_00481]